MSKVEEAKAAGVFGVGGGAGGAPGVDEHGAAGGADDQERVALADIDGGDFERVGMDGGREGQRTIAAASGSAAMAAQT